MLHLTCLKLDKVAPVGCNRTSSHETFDAKVGFTRFAILILHGHKNQSPEGSTHYGVASRESVKIDFVCEALRDADFWAYSIQHS